MEKVQTGVPGLDEILDGGIPRGSLVLVAGPPGAGKTILSTQIAAQVANRGRKVVILTALSEATAKLVAYLSGLEYFQPEQIGAEIQILNIQRMLADEGLDATLNEIRSSVVEQGIELLIIDSLRSLDVLANDEVAVQSFIFGLGSALFMLGCTTILVEDQYYPEGATSSKQAISDSIIKLDVVSSGRAVSRQVEIVKVRGAAPVSGRHSFEITGSGLRVYPRVETLVAQDNRPEGGERMHSGISGFDAIIRGGFPARSSTLLLGTPGIGKTTFGLQFVAEGLKQGDSCLYVTSHETSGQLVAKARHFRMDLQPALNSNLLRFMEVVPNGCSIDKAAHSVLDDIRARGVQRLVVDTVEPMEQDANREGRFLSVISTLVRFLRAEGVTTLITRELPQVAGQALDIAGGGESPWVAIDNIILLRMVEINASLKRVISVIKMRSSEHDDSFHYLTVGDEGLQVGESLEGFGGLLVGIPHKLT